MKSKELEYIAAVEEIISFYADYTPEEIEADEDFAWRVDRAAKVVKNNDFASKTVTCEATHEYEPRTHPVFKTKEQVIEYGKEKGWIA